MDFIELTVQAPRELADILVAELGEVGFDTFEDNDAGFCAYTTEEVFDRDAVAEIMSRYEGLGELAFSDRVITRQNWNQEWGEKFSAPHYCRPRVGAGAVSPQARGRGVRHRDNAAHVVWHRPSRNHGLDD